jgi:hypothetical protein
MPITEQIAKNTRIFRARTIPTSGNEKTLEVIVGLY